MEIDQNEGPSQNSLVQKKLNIFLVSALAQSLSRKK
jgi:hypothetical protein